MRVPAELVKTMGLTETELRRGLAAVGHFEAGRAGGRLITPEGVVELAWRILPSRRLGALVLPVLELRLDLAALARDARADFLKRFQLGFQRGGG